MKKLPTLRGRTVVNLFYESSTRTSSSFELAAKRLSADTMSIKAAGSSVDKGESLKDTALTIAAYDPDVIVIRHPHIGAPQLVAAHTGAHVVNAGDGKHQHPTQALLDLYTLEQEVGELDGLHVAIVGDVLHSRVARSLVQALVLMDARVTLVGPPALLPRGIESLGCETSIDIDAIDDADVVYVLRMQRERMQEGANYVPSLREYAARWGVTPERCGPGQKVMHPGPMNRGVEIDGAGRGRGRRADRRAGARGPRVAHGCALRPADARPGRGRSRRGRGGGVMLFARRDPGADLVIRGARVLDPAHGIDAVMDVRVDGGVIAGLGDDLADERAPRRRRRGQAARAGVRRPARPPAHARPGGRGDDRDRHAGGRGRRLLRDPRHAQHRPGHRFGGRARLADRRRPRDGRGAGWLPRRDLEGPERAPS